jgi:hypothetical protein
MKRIKVIREGKETHKAEGPNAEMDAWRDYCVSINKFGKPERWVRAEDEDVSAALETREVELEPAVLDDQGNVVTPAVMVNEYRLAAQFTVVEEDITAEVAAQKAKEDAKKAALEKIKNLNVDAKFGPVADFAALRAVMKDVVKDIIEALK